MGILRQSTVIGGTAIMLAALAMLPFAGAPNVLAMLPVGALILLLLLLVVALRFSELRTLLTTLSLLAFVAMMQCVAPSAQASHWLVALIAVDLAFIAALHEPMVDWEIVAWWSGWLLVSFGVLAIADRWMTAWLAASVVVGSVDARLLISLTAACFAFAMIFLRRDPVSTGIAWASFGLAFAHFRLERTLLFVVIAAVTLAVSMMERSYWIAYFDELTGIRGRRALREAFDSLRGGYTVAVVDVDHFKAFNDTYGHDVGDQVLRKVAAQLARVGGGGEAFRCGGEEFALLFRDRDASQALPHAEKLRRAIEDDVFHVRGPERSTREREERRRFHKKDRHSRHEAVAITVSIGLAQAPDGFSPQQVYKAADRALYRAKHAGRNRVEVARRAPTAAMATNEA